uniref:Putative secreted peptide n=1 Tax=Anopheles braziliensis TaxID=58242 RepID=A0A2M3ZX40_9DIPT
MARQFRCLLLTFFASRSLSLLSLHLILAAKFEGVDRLGRAPGEVVEYFNYLRNPRQPDGLHCPAQRL